jgi:hypothetical protein
MNTVYALLCPITNEPKYVGVTSDLTRRMHGHKYTKDKNPVAVWTRGLRAKGLAPVCIELDEDVLCKQANAGEIFWIEYLRSLGANLLNVRKGGGGIWADEMYGSKGLIARGLCPLDHLSETDRRRFPNASINLAAHGSQTK